MARREKHRRAERFARAGIVFDEVLDIDNTVEDPRRLPRNGYPPGAFELGVLQGLQGADHVYQGTVAAGVIADRRAANRRARKARRRARLARA